MKKITSALALCLTLHLAMAQTTNLTQKILHMRTFREGLVLTGKKQPGAAENKELLQVLDHLNETWWRAGLEQFLKDYPASPWAASLHYDYASFCRRTGRTTKALEQFQAAWKLLKNDGSLQGRRLGGAVLAQWTELLASLGRSKELKPLIAAGDRWRFANPRDREKFEGAKNSYYLMQEHPGIAYRCGTFALKAVGSVMQPNNPALESLVAVPSPTNGFSMAQLVKLSKQYGLNMVPVRRTKGQALIVPSVVHWRQNHYAAILKKKDGLYLVSDPTFGGEKWMPANVINEEASGEFLIPASRETNGWRQLAHNEIQKIHGMGLPNNIDDGKDRGKKPPCPGMPVWWVSEPYINLWMADQPISYLTSDGKPFTFQITYKQRDTRPGPNDYMISTAGWNNSWLSYIRCDSSTPCRNPYGTGCLTGPGAGVKTTVYLPNGGEVDFNGGQNYDPETRLQIQLVSPVGALSASSPDNGNNGLRLIHADGSQDIYGMVIVIPVFNGEDSQTEFLRTRHIAPNGDTTFFAYALSAGGGQEEWVLTHVIDPDGRTNTLAYTGDNLLSAMTNAYGRSAHFKYDSDGNLTNIVDAAGMSSSILYDTNDVPTALITPYGTNRFDVFENSIVADTNNGEGDFGGDDLIDRAIRATDPTGANSLYLYRYDCSSATPLDMPTTFSPADVPTNTPLGTLDDGSDGTNFLKGVCYRNSFYWGPRQYEGLSTTNMADFTAGDYLRGQMKHWLEDTDQLDLTGYLSVERNPSPDGSTPGLLTFYDYAGKLPGENFCAGTSPLPSVRAWRLPDGETHYEYQLFDYFGNVTNDITTYTKTDGSLGTRTNRFIYAGNTYTYTLGGWNGSQIYGSVSASYTVPDLLVRVIGADGNTNWSYGGFDTVSWTNFFYQESGGQTNATTLTSSRVLPDYATNALGQVTTTTYTSGGNPVTFYDMNWSLPTWPYTNNSYGSPLLTVFPGYDKITSHTSVAGLTTTNLYDTNGFLAQTITLQTGATNSFGYTTNGLISAFTNELELSMSPTWDNLLRLTGIQYPDGHNESITYNNLDVSEIQDRADYATFYDYDGARHLTTVTQWGNGGTHRYTTLDWCGCGALTSVTDPMNRQTAFNYDDAGNLTNISYPDGSSLNYQLNLAGQVTNIFDGAGRALRLTYNNQGLLTKVTGAAGTLRSVVYDILDRPYIVTDANGVTVTNTYNALNQLIKHTWSDGISESYGYNAAGLIAYTNRDNEATHYGRNAAGWLMAVTNANNEVALAGYNPAGEITALTNGLGNVVKWQYNEFGWMTNKTDGLGRDVLQLTYNPDGQVLNVWTPEKGNTLYYYDSQGNIQAVFYSGVFSFTPDVIYGYDADNELYYLVDSTGTTIFTYTSMGQLASESNAWATVQYNYSQGLRTNLTIGSWNQSYGYDGNWRMTNTVSPAGTFTYAYLSSIFNLPSSISFSNGAYITNSFDGLARLKETDLNNYWGHTLDGYSYSLDPLGLKTNIVRNFGLTSSSVAVGYDNIRQITSWLAQETNGTPRLNEQLGFGYDAADNLHLRTNNALVQTFTVDAANELTSISRSGTFTLSGATPAPATGVTVNGQSAQTYGDFTFASAGISLANGNNTFTNIAQNVYGLKVTNTFTVNLPQSAILLYDANGNLTNDGVHFFAYDKENELTNVTVAGQFKKDFVYDGLRRLRVKKEYAWTGSSWTETNETRYIWDGNDIVQLRDSNNVPILTLTRGLDMSGSLQGAGGIGGLLAMTDGSGVNYYYHQDGMGNVTALMDSQENIVARRMYDAFGRTINLTGSKAGLNPFWFASQLHDDSLGADIYRYRTLLHGIQRWSTPDPAGLTGGINPFGFADNNPVNAIDTDGREVLNYYQAQNGEWTAKPPEVSARGAEGAGIVAAVGVAALGEGQIALDLGIQNAIMLGGFAADQFAFNQKQGNCPPNNSVQPFLGMAAKTAPRAFWVGADGEAAAQASGAQLLKPSQAALDAAKAGDWSVMRTESAAWAKGASGDVPVFFGNGKGRIFLNDELPELLKNMDAGKVKTIQIDF